MRDLRPMIWRTSRLARLARPTVPVMGATRYEGAIEYREAPPEVAIGVVVPFDFELDWEYWRYLPAGANLHFTRTPYLNKAVDVGLAREIGKPQVVADATRSLISLHPAATLYACSSGSFVRGLAGEREIRRAMVKAGARAAVTTSGAMLEALRAAGATRVALATPYTEALTNRLRRFLEEAGFQVPSAHYLGLTTAIYNVGQGTVANLVRRTAEADVDAVFVSCTSLRTFGIVAQLEEQIGVPVFTSNQVSLWGALQAAHVSLADAASGGPSGEGWVLGGGHPMARSTGLLLEASGRGSREGAA